MKKMKVVIIAIFGFLITMTQCKKNIETITPNSKNDMVYITLDVDQIARADVNTINGVVTFQSGDMIHVGSNGAYVGTLTHNGNNFTGPITNPTIDQPLYFYFIGNVTPVGTFNVGATTCEVVINDQTSSFPVISYGRSKDVYTSGTTAFKAHLNNYCALVKFTPDIATMTAITIKGVKNKVTVDFGNTATPYTYSQYGEGDINLYSASAEEKWAILLPQNGVTDGIVSVSGYTGTFTVGDIINNAFITDATISLTSQAPSGVINGLFTVSDNHQVYFSIGNLQYHAKYKTWHFADNQYDIIGSANSNIADNYDGWIDLFGWGTSGYNSCNPWMTSTDDAIYANGSANINGTNYDWGVQNHTDNGGSNQYRTLTINEWNTIINTRSASTIGETQNARYTMAKVANVEGLILFPDSYTHPSDVTLPTSINVCSDYNGGDYSSDDFAKMENAGAVFLPAAGYRHNNPITISNVGSVGAYWSATGNGTYDAQQMYFQDTGVGIYKQNKNTGRSVRLVSDAS